MRESSGGAVGAEGGEVVQGILPSPQENKRPVEGAVYDNRHEILQRDFADCYSDENLLYSTLRKMSPLQNTKLNSPFWCHCVLASVM